MSATSTATASPPVSSSVAANDSSAAADSLSEYHFPEEVRSHTAVLLIWPFSPTTFRDAAVHVQRTFTEFVNKLIEYEHVVVAFPSEAASKSEAASQLNSKIQRISMPLNDSWARDIGPSIVIAKDTQAKIPAKGVVWQFNCYGAASKGWKVDYSNDQHFAARILNHFGIPSITCPIILEGGAFQIDGEGTCLATEECVLHENRKLSANEVRTKESMEAILKKYLDVQKVIWFPQGVAFDRDTNGHVDNLACFVRPTEVCLAWTDDPSDPQHAISVDALNRLKEATDAKGRPFTVHKIPIPAPLLVTEEEARGFKPVDGIPLRQPGDRLPASYVNYYVANGAIFVPGFNQPEADGKAVKILEGLYPERKVVTIQSREILLGGGNLHCITQQIPIEAKIRHH